MNRGLGFTMISLIAILSMMGALSVIIMKMKVSHLREMELVTVAESIIKVAQKYDQYYVINCGASFTAPAVSALGLDSSLTSGFVNASPLLLGIKIPTGGFRYLTISTTFTKKNDAVTVTGMLGEGAVLEADNKTTTYSFLPSISLNSQSRKNWFGGVNCF
jgi:hypothetical protein